jgi:hypothetical protein
MGPLQGVQFKGVSFASVASSSAGGKFTADPDLLAEVAVQGIMPAEELSNNHISVLQSLMPSACYSLPFNAGRIYEGIGEALQVLESEVKALSNMYGQIYADLISAARQYLTADQLSPNLVNARLLALTSGSIVGGGATAQYLSIEKDPANAGETVPADYETWCKANGDWSDGEYTQCVCWARYERSKLGLPSIDGNGCSQYKVAPCGASQVTVGSLISMSTPAPYGHVLVVESVSGSPGKLQFTCSELNVSGAYGAPGNFRTNTTFIEDGSGWSLTRSGYGRSTYSVPYSGSDVNFSTGL